MPFHKGHESLIEYAKNNCDSLTILVAAQHGEPIEYKYRLKWVLSTYLDDPQVDVFGDVVNEPDFNTSDEKSVWWGEYVNTKFGKFDRVFSSEDYGKVFAETMNAENYVFDKDRVIIPISGTLIRNKPLTHWDKINNFAKDYFTKKICIVGTESTGKTTLCKRLASHYNTNWCPEVGDDIINKSDECSVDDLKIVGMEHAKSIIKHTRMSNKILFMDTDLNITKSYAKYLFNEDLHFPPWVEKANKADLYILLQPDAPYLDDGRRLSKNKRDELQKYHEEQLKLNVYHDSTIISFTGNSAAGFYDYEFRFNNIVEEIDRFLSKF